MDQAFLERIAQRAAGLIGPSRTSKKRDGSPLTSSDLAVEDFLVSELKKRYPLIPILSEESKDDRSRLGSEYCFVIDPIDGTASLAEGREDYAILIGLVRAGRSIMGVCHAPEQGSTYSASLGNGAWLNGRRITANGAGDVVGRYNIDRDLEDFFLKEGKDVCDVPKVGSFGLKVCLVAEGIYSRFVHTNFDPDKVHASIWDAAPVDIILTEAGGSATDFLGNELDYSSPETALTSGFIARSNLLP